MSLHILSDVFSHASYAKIGGEWTYLDHVNNNKADVFDFKKMRYEAAKRVCRKALARAEKGRLPSADVFIIDAKYYDGTYKIHKLFERIYFSYHEENVSRDMWITISNVSYKGETFHFK